MNAATFLTPAEKSVPSEGRPSAEKASAMAQQSKAQVHIDTDADRMSSTLIRMISNSVSELGALVSELQEVQTFLKSEGERIQREITNYAQLNQSALAAIKVITQTIGPWKSTVLESDSNASG